MTPVNTALWMNRRGGRLAPGPAPYTPPGPGEVVVRVRAVAVNPIDAMPGLAYRLILPWVTFPAVIGSDVAGDVVETGPDVTRPRPGDRVLGHAVGLARSRNRAAEGAFQHYVVLPRHMVAAIPGDLAFEQAAVLPMTLSTAATGLFQEDHLALALPPAHAAEAVDRGETVVVWGGSTSVGSNAIQLARCAGYRVLTTASPRNFGYVRSLGADVAVDYHQATAADELIAAIGDSPLAGVLAIGAGSLRAGIALSAGTTGSRRVAAAQPGALTRLQSLVFGARRRGVRVSGIWGDTLKDNEVGPAIYNDFLPAALSDGRYQAAPRPLVAGTGLEAIPDALRRLRAGVSAQKVVVTI
jgi:NADPH:quinone reductase-like Zn-dependent oxidoreductase